MSKVLVTESYLTDIGNAIRSKNSSTDKYKPGEMANAIKNIKIAEQQEYKINIEQSDNQTITVQANYNTAYGYSGETSSFSMKPVTCYPHTVTATIQANPGYKAGTLNHESFSFSSTNRTVTFSATPAIEVKSVTYKTTNSPYIFEDVINYDTGAGIRLYNTLGIDYGSRFYAIGDADIPSDFKTASNSVMQVIENDETIVNTEYSGYTSICKNFYLISIPSTNDIYIYCYANYDNDTDLLTNTEYKNPTIKIGTLTLDLSNFTRTFDKQHYLPPDKKQYACNTYHIKDADLMKQLNLVFCGNEVGYKENTYTNAYTYIYNWFVKMFEILLSSDSTSLATVKTEFKKYEQPTSDLNNFTSDKTNKIFQNIGNKFGRDALYNFLDAANDTNKFADNTQSSFLEKTNSLSSLFGGVSDIKKRAYMFITFLTTAAKASDTDTTSYNLLDTITCAYHNYLSFSLSPITAKDLPIEITYQYISTFE